MQTAAEKGFYCLLEQSALESYIMRAPRRLSNCFLLRMCSVRKEREGGGLTWPGQTGAEPSPARASSQSDDAETVEFSTFLQKFRNLNLKKIQSPL